MTTITRQIHFKTKARRKTLAKGAKPVAITTPGRIPRVSKLMALAIRYDQMLNDGVVASQSDLAKLLYITQPRMTQIMNLLHLAPEIQEELLRLPPVEAGSDPITERDLRSATRLMDWSRQKMFWDKHNRSLVTVNRSV